MNQLKKYISLFLLFLFYSNSYCFTNKDSVINNLTNGPKEVREACMHFETAIKLKDFVNSDQFFQSAIKLAEVNNSTNAVTFLRMIIEDELTAKGNYKKSLDYLLKLKTTADRIKFSKGATDILNGIGVVYWHQGDNENALKFFQENLESLKQFNIKADIGAAYNNIGLIYRQMGKNELALSYYAKSLQYGIDAGDYAAQANAYNNIGVIYQFKGEYNKAKYYYEKSLNYRKLINDSVGISISLGNIGVMLLEQNKTDSALTYLINAYGISERANDLEGIEEMSEALSRLYEKEHNNELALKYFKEYVSVRDTLNNQALQREAIQKEMQYRFDKEEEKKAILVEAEKKKQQLFTALVIVILLIVLVFSALLYKRFNLTKKQKTIIENQKQLVEHKQKEITDSIHYAKRIQSTLLAHNDFLNKNLPQHFVLYKPKDIVSGDFYWATSTDSATHKYFYLAVCDSTGHGVPGAFMSLLNISFLNEAINEKGINEPNKVFNHLRKRLIENISQDGGQDGMDGVLIQFDLNNQKITYSAANNLVVLIRNGNIIELEYDKMPVGKGAIQTEFSSFTYDLVKGDSLYLFTDGFADQFGGPKGKKFKYKQLNELLMEICNAPVSVQKERLSSAFEKWKGDLEQVDDVCVIGIKI